MESNQVWLDKLKNVLRQHIYSGLSKTMADINNICKGRNLPGAVQVAMEGIPYLSSRTLKMDYMIFLDSLKTSGLTEQKFNELIKRNYYVTAISALKNADISCQNLKVDFMDGAIGMDFIHLVYINTGRYIWYDPQILIQDYNIPKIIDNGIEKTIIDGVDLEKLISDLKNSHSDTVSINRTPFKIPQTSTQKINSLPNAKNIIDSSDDDDSDFEDEMPTDPKTVNKCEMPPQPIFDDIETIEDGEGPDTRTINIHDESIYQESLASVQAEDYIKQRGSSPSFRRGSSPSFRRGSSPSFRRGSSPSFRRGSSPSYRRGSSPSFRRGSSPSYRRGSSPSYRRGSSPSYRRGTSPTLQSEDTIIKQDTDTIYSIDDDISVGDLSDVDVIDDDNHTYKVKLSTTNDELNERLSILNSEK
jgi:hypothetical protein